MISQDKYDTKKFESGLRKLDLCLDKTQINQFLRYYEMLMEWTRRINLTAITGFDDVVRKHFLDSLCLVKAIPKLSDQRLLDLGTGAGFPGIPLKIAFPGLNVGLMDSVGKKLNFVDEVIRTLGLTGAFSIHGRAEDLARDKSFRRQFDLCVARAVADLSALAEYGLPFVKTGGLFIAYKSADVEDECERADKAIRLLGGKRGAVVPYSLPGGQGERTLVCIKKIKGTPGDYPRKAGTPTRNPLK